MLYPLTSLSVYVYILICNDENGEISSTGKYYKCLFLSFKIMKHGILNVDY